VTTGPTLVATFEHVTHRYGRSVALDDVGLTLERGCFAALVGPDGVGKSTLLALLAGARKLQGGRVFALGGDMADARHRSAACPRIAYMPQGLGRNLYPDLSVAENITFFGRLFGQGRREREQRMASLLHATGLAEFADRPARNLSGGMRQKLGLCCALIHDPDLLILDEPTTGVDPLSRRQFWNLLAGMRAERTAMSVVAATAYMDEAERFERIVAMNAGRILASGSPAEIKALAGQESLEESFIALLPAALRAGRTPLVIPPRSSADHEVAITARHLTRRFDAFTAVDDVSFTIGLGEIFGFVGSNGCGKTTTMKMLTGLLPASEGEALLFGQPIDAGDLRLRERVGYMSQSFSLYAELTVRQNLDLHARLYHLPRVLARARIGELIAAFGLTEHVDQRAAALPLGIRQRLSLAVAVVHQPELLILDEPTSGVDPLARDQFWTLLIDLSRRHGVTIFISTHFMNEAARCDRVALMHAGRVLATGTPVELTQQYRAADLEGAFITCLEQATQQSAAVAAVATAVPAPRGRAMPGFIQPAMAYAIREGLELWRDRTRLAFALLGTAFLMLVFGFGVNTDVDHLRFAVLDRDRTPESLDFLKEMRGSIYFDEMRPIVDDAALERRLASGDISVAIEVPSGFGRDVRGDRPAEVGAWIDGAMPFRAETIRGYLQGVQQAYLANLAAARGEPATASPADIAIRFRYNQDFESAMALVPAQIALQLALIPAILMSLAVVREKELGSITNLYVTPVTRLQFIIGKQAPYVAVSLVNFLLLVVMATMVFSVPLKGSFPALALASLIYVVTTTGYGLLISSFAGSQIAALFGTAILTVLPAVQFSGMMTPVDTLSGVAALMGRLFPMSYYLPICVGAFTKSLGFAELWPTILELAVFIPALTLLSLLLLRKQER
jgi:ribosome-dependent ATPase